MKKHAIILLVFLAGSASIATAQTGKLELGIQAGPSVISLRGNDFVENTNSTGIGFSSGLFVQYNINETISLRADPAYERKGSLVRTDVFDEAGNQIAELTLHQNLDYITLPVLVRASFGDKFKFFANAGPYVSLLVRDSPGCPR